MTKCFRETDISLMICTSLIHSLFNAFLTHYTCLHSGPSVGSFYSIKNKDMSFYYCLWLICVKKHHCYTNCSRFERLYCALSCVKIFLWNSKWCQYFDQTSISVHSELYFGILFQQLWSDSPSLPVTPTIYLKEQIYNHNTIGQV